MNENILDFIYKVLMIFVFLLAITVFLLIYKSMKETIDTFDSAYNNEKVIYESNYDSEYYVTGADLIGLIYIGLEKDIEINGQLITKSIDKNTFNYNVINPKAKYIPTTIINEDGEITKIKYESID